jgi:hypothetical protein
MPVLVWSAVACRAPYLVLYGNLSNAVSKEVPWFLMNELRVVCKGSWFYTSGSSLWVWLRVQGLERRVRATRRAPSWYFMASCQCGMSTLLL